MDKVHIPQIEQQLRLNRSVKTSNTDKSLFYLYLSMLEKDLSVLPRFTDTTATNEIVYADIESHYYKHPELQFSAGDFAVQKQFSRALEQKSDSTFKLLNAFFPQGLSEYNNPLRIDDEVIEGLDYFAQKRTKEAQAFNHQENNQNDIAVDETLLFDLIPKATEFTL